MIRRSLSKSIRLAGFSISLTLCIGVYGLVFLFAQFRAQVPDFNRIEDYHPRQVTRVLASDGRLIAEYAKERRILISSDKIPDILREAFIVAEDKNFRAHDGIDFFGIGNAILERVSGRRKQLRGASTITQQLAKSLLIEEEGFRAGSERSFGRKLKEAIMARRLEATLTKEEIIWMYLNQVYLGHGAYGVEAAAQTYFSKHASDLNVAESAILAGLPKAPSRFSPLSNPSSARIRQQYVLKRLVEEGHLEDEERQSIKRHAISHWLKPMGNVAKSKVPYFSEHVRRYLYEKYGEAALYENGLVVTTTLDLNRDIEAQNAMQYGLEFVDKRQGFQGPQAHFDNVDQWLQVIEATQEALQGGHPRDEETHYLAVVTEINLEHEFASIQIGHHEGILPLAAMGWAREQAPNKIWHQDLIPSLEGVIHEGDILWVRPMQKSDILGRTSTPRAKQLLREMEPLEHPLYILEQPPAVEGALVAIAPKTGYLESLVGGYNFEDSEFNRASQACRQPGSAFKPITYSAAIALKDYTPASMIFDAPLTFRWNDKGSTWKPNNFEKQYAGEVTMREAIMKSMNVPTLNISRDVGVNNVVNWARAVGIKSTLKRELGTAIGSSCVSPFELAEVYANFSRLGERKPTVFIKSVVDRRGKVLEEYFDGLDPWVSREERLKKFWSDWSDPPEKVMSEETAYLTNFLLTQVVNHGTGRRARSLDKVLAGKTGTTNDSYDTWFVGYTPALVSVVWVGFDQMVLPLGRFEQGARTALPIWQQHMAFSLKGLPNESWRVPNNICFASVDENNGGWLADDAPNSFVSPFICGTEPDPILGAGSPSIREALSAPGGL